MNSIVIISSFLITYKLFRISNFIDSLTCCFTVCFAQIVFTELILGILGTLYLKNIILLNLLILLSIWLITKNRMPYFDLSGIKNVILGLLKNRIILLSVSIILGFGLVKVCINLINPPFGWDCLNYHFVFPVEWLKHGNLENPITIADDPSPSYYPVNGSLFFLWLIFPFKNVLLADLGQIPFFLLVFLAVYSLGKKVGLNKENSFLAACLFTLIPNYFKQMEVAYVDVMVAGMFLVSLNYLFLINEEFKWENALIYSIALGLLLGTKTIALPYSMLLFLPFIYLSFRNINKLYLLIMSIFVIFVLGGFSYIRNFIDTGNPLYPLDFKLFGRFIFKGVMDITTYRAHFKPQDYNLSKLLFHEGLGIQSLVFIFPALLLGLPIILLKKKKINFNLVYFLALPVLIYLIYRYVIPLANARYLYPLLGAGIIIGFYIFEILNIPKRVMGVLVVICGLASAGEISSHAELVVSLTLTFLLFFLLWFYKFQLSFRYIFLSIIFLAVSLIPLEKYYINNEYARYIRMTEYSGFWPDATKAWNWLNQNTNGNNIAYVGRPVPFPLYGTNFKNNVFYVSVNKTDPAKLHYFPDSHYYWGYDFLDLHKNLQENQNYRGNADYLVWFNNLLRRNADYLFVYSLHQTKDIEFPFEDNWAKVNPARFIPAFTNETIHIYKISR